LMAAAAGFLPPYLASPEVDIRGHAVWAAAALEDERLRPIMKELAADDGKFYLYRDLRLEAVSIGELLNNQA
jgi:hypothetical protein